MRKRTAPLSRFVSFLLISLLVYKDRRITIVIPCLNEEKGIVEVLSGMPSFVDEVLVVDNDSTDRTAELAGSLGARVIHEKIRGYGRAYKTGLFQAQGDIIVTLDGDHSYPVDAISYLLEVFLRSKVQISFGFPVSTKEPARHVTQTLVWEQAFECGDVSALSALGQGFPVGNVGF